MGSRQRNEYGLMVYDPAKAFNGYTIFAEMGNNNVWLIDMRGRILHRWKMAPFQRGMYGILLANGHLLYVGKTGKEPFPDFGGSFGLIVEVDWNGNEVWRYEDTYMSHDFFKMANGNIMVLRWLQTPHDIIPKIKGGLPGTEREGEMWSDGLHEITPEGKVVWEWKSYEHFDFDKDTINPVLLRDRWGQANAVHVMPDGNILLSFAYLDQIAIVEKSTGDVTWRWGGHGVLGFQHNPTVLDNGNILLFDNGRCRFQPPDYSRIIEVNPKTNQVEWEYMDNPPVNFYGSFMGSAQRLPNGNTLVCEAPKGHFFEISPDGEIVWDYINPFFFETARFGKGTKFGKTNMTFRANRYSPDYAGLKGTGLDDWNILYGPQEYTGIGSFQGRSNISSFEEDKGSPSIASKDDMEKKQEERQRLLGY